MVQSRDISFIQKASRSRSTGNGNTTSVVHSEIYLEKLESSVTRVFDVSVMRCIDADDVC